MRVGGVLVTCGFVFVSVFVSVSVSVSVSVCVFSVGCILVSVVSCIGCVAVIIGVTCIAGIGVVSGIWSCVFGPGVLSMFSLMFTSFVLLFGIVVESGGGCESYLMRRYLPNW